MADSNLRPKRTQAVEENVDAQRASVDEEESVDERVDPQREMDHEEDQTPAVVSEAESEELLGKTLTTAETISPVQAKKAGTPVTLSKMILAARGKDHRIFCTSLIDSEMLGKASTQVKRARTLAISEQMKIAPEKETLYDAILTFQLLPGVVEFKKIGKVNFDRDGNLMEAVESWVQTAEQSNMCHREFFSALVKGETLIGELRTRYETWVGRDHFRNDKAETSANDMNYWGRKILKWMASLVTVAGVVPEMTEIVYR
jgi:hypothetical protein